MYKSHAVTTHCRQRAFSKIYAHFTHILRLSTICTQYAHAQILSSYSQSGPRYQVKQQQKCAASMEQMIDISFSTLCGTYAPIKIQDGNDPKFKLPFNSHQMHLSPFHFLKYEHSLTWHPINTEGLNGWLAQWNQLLPTLTRKMVINEAEFTI